MKKGLLIIFFSLFLMLENVMPGSAEVATFTSGIKYTGGTFQNSTDLYLNTSRIKNDRDEPAEGTPKQKKTGQPGSEHVVAEANKADWITQGIGLENQGRLHEAREAFSKSIVAHRDETLAYLHRAKVNGMLGSCQQAIEDYSVVIEKMPKDASAYKGRAAAYECTGKSDEALRDYNKAAEMTPRDAEVFYHRAIVLTALHMYEQAVSDFSRSLLINPARAIVYFRRGEVYSMLNRHAKAVEDYNKAIEMNLDLPSVYISRGDAHSKLNNNDNALSDYETAAVLHPDKDDLKKKIKNIHVALFGNHSVSNDITTVSNSTALDPSRSKEKLNEMLRRDVKIETNRFHDTGDNAGHHRHESQGEKRKKDENRQVFYTIQVLSSTNRRSMDKSISLLEKEGFDNIRIVKNGKRYVLRVSKYNDRSEGASTLDRLRKYYAGAVLVAARDRELVVSSCKKLTTDLTANEKMRPYEKYDTGANEQLQQAEAEPTANYLQDGVESYESGYMSLPEYEPGTFSSYRPFMSDIILAGFSNEEDAGNPKNNYAAPVITYFGDDHDDAYGKNRIERHDETLLLSQNVLKEELPPATESEKAPTPLSVHNGVSEPEVQGKGIEDTGQKRKYDAEEKTDLDRPVSAAPAPDAKGTVIGDLYQDSKATVTFRGVVINSYGKPLVGARIELINMPQVKAFSDAGGAFSLEGVPEGDKFLIKIEMDGFLETYVSGFQYPSAAKDPYWITMHRIPGSVPPDKTQRKPVNIEADSMSYERDKDTYHAHGNVIMTHEGDPGGVMTSDEASLNHAINEAESSGNVVVRSGRDIIYGDRMVMDTETKKGKVYNGRMFMSKNHFYIKGDKIEKTGEASYFVENATATTCDGDSPDWSIRSSELDITVDGYGTAKHGRFMAKGIPVAYSPYFVFPVKTTRQSGFLFPYMSYSRDKLGWDVELPFYWAISKSMDATFYQRYMSERGFKEGVEFRYAMSPNHYGTFYADFLRDKIRKKEILSTTTTLATNATWWNVQPGQAGTIWRDWDNDKNRWSVYLNHISNFSPTFYLRTDIAKVSDNWYFKDFSSHNYYLSNYSKTDENRYRKISFVGDETLNSLTSTVRLVKNWNLYNLTGLVSYTDDFSQQNNNATLQQYPQITLTGMKQPLFKTPVNYELTSLYSYNYRGEGQRGQLFDIKPDFTLPVNFGRYAQLTPRFGWKGTTWDRDDKQEDTGNRRGTRQTTYMGAVLNTEIQRIFNVGIGSVEKIRHSIKPELTYNYIPYVSQVDIPNYVAQIYDQDALTYALTNTLTARLKDKSGKVSYREIMRLKLAQLYDFKESRRSPLPTERDNRPFSFIDAELDINPFQYLSFSARNKYSVNAGEWRQANYDMTLRDWRGDIVSLGYRDTYNTTWSLPDIYNTQGAYSRDLYIQDPSVPNKLKEITLLLKAVITDNWEATYFQRRNEATGTDTERTFSLQYQKQCWSIKVSYIDKKFYDAYGVEQPDRAFMVYLSFYGLGAIGTK